MDHTEEYIAWLFVLLLKIPFHLFRQRFIAVLSPCAISPMTLFDNNQVIILIQYIQILLHTHHPIPQSSTYFPLYLHIILRVERWAGEADERFCSFVTITSVIPSGRSIRLLAMSIV